MNDALKITAKGILFFVLSFIVAKLLMAFGFLVIACFFTVAFGCVAPIWLVDKRCSSGALILGIFGIIFSGIVPALTTDYSGLGFSKKSINLSEIKNYPNTSIFTFNDAHVVDSIYGHGIIMGRRYKVGDVYVSPIVSSNWNPKIEITAWAVSDLREDDDWKKEFKAGVRTIESDDTREAINDAAKDNGVKTSPDAVLLYWCKNPYREFQSDFFAGLMVPIAIILVWTVVSLASFNYTMPPEEPRNVLTPEEEERIKEIEEIKRKRDEEYVYKRPERFYRKHKRKRGN